MDARAERLTRRYLQLLRDAVLDDSPGARNGRAYTAIGRRSLDHLERCVEVIRDEAIGGDLVDCGAGRGGAAIFMRGLLEAHGLTGPRVWVADRFDS